MGYLDSDNISSRWAFGTVRDFKFYTLAFSKSFETIASDGWEMNENVLAAIFWGNEAETFGLIEPLNATFNLRHQTYLYVNVGHKSCVNYSTAIELFFVHSRDHKKKRKSEKRRFIALLSAQKATFFCFYSSL